MDLTKRAFAEFLGTFWLVLGGCGTAVISARVPGVGVGILGVALAFGLTVVTGMYAFGALSGGHFNPAITLGLATARRFPTSEVLPYWAAQVAGAIVASLILYLVAHGAPQFSATASGFAANGYGSSLAGRIRAGRGAPLRARDDVHVRPRRPRVDAFDCAQGLRSPRDRASLTLIHLVSIPVTNTSVNPARSTGPALFAGEWAIGQLWLFWIAPLVGGAIAGVVHPALVGDRPLEQLRAEARDLALAPRLCEVKRPRRGEREAQIRRGKSAENCVPSSGQEVAHILPPWVRAISCAMKSPRPSPTLFEGATTYAGTDRRLSRAPQRGCRCLGCARQSTRRRRGRARAP